MTDLRDVTNFVHYENFRCRKLAGVAGTDKVCKNIKILKPTKNCHQVPNKNPLFMMEEEQKEHVAKLNKMEREMEEVFERKVSR